MMKVSIDTWKLRELAKDKPEQYRELYGLGRGVPPIDKIESSWGDFTAYINSPEDLPDWLLEIVRFEVLKPLKMMTDTGGVKAESVKEACFRSQVHLPGNELLAIREMEVVVDGCTEEINSRLQAGWRIIAVCPQASQRRPDYVLGRN